MRINIYEEELRGMNIELVEQTSREGIHFTGLRFWLDSPPSLTTEHTPGDDDTSAVTFWFRSVRDIVSLVARAADAAAPGSVT